MKKLDNRIAKGILLALAIGFSTLLASRGYSQELVSLQSTNYRDSWLRHRKGLCFIDKIGESDALAQKDASFKLVSGISGDGGTVSFESVNFPGHYLRHQNGRLKLGKNTGDELFKADATFLEVDALNGSGVSYESVNFPGNYIRHKKGEVWVEKSDGSKLFKNDASFFKVEAFTSK